MSLLMSSVFGWLVGRSKARPGVSREIGSAALGRLCESLAGDLGCEKVAADIASIREANLATAKAKRARCERIIASAASAAELALAKDRDRLQKEAEQLTKRIAAAKNENERNVLITELMANHAERFERGHERFQQSLARMREKGRTVLFDEKALQRCIAEGKVAQARIVAGNAQARPEVRIPPEFPNSVFSPKA